jgi:hypothetical protein
MDPGTSEKFGNARNFIILSYVQEGKFAEALEEQNRQYGGSQYPWTWAMKAYIYGRWGKKKEFQLALKKFQQLAPQLTEPHRRSSLPISAPPIKTRFSACWRRLIRTDLLR